MKKDKGFNIRVNKGLRTDFVQVCRTEDKVAAQVLREFMRSYVEEHRGLLQQTLFSRRKRRAR